MGFISSSDISIPKKDLISWIFDDQKYDEDKPIYIDVRDPNRFITSRQARLLIRKLAQGFQHEGLQAGDCVGIHAFNDIYYSMICLGAIAAGGVFSGTNPSSTSTELAEHIRTCNTKFLIIEPELLDTATCAAKMCGLRQSRIWIFDVLNQATSPGFQSWTTLLQYGEADWIRFDEPAQANTPAALFHSSGTTGLPKSAILTHFNIVAQHTLVHEVVQKPFEVRRLIAIPTFHVGAALVTHTSALRSGHQTFIMRRFELESFLTAIDEHQITDVPIVPPMIISILKSSITKTFSLASIKYAWTGAAPIAKETQNEFQKLLSPGSTITQTWGMTEMSCLVSMFYWPEGDDTGSVGRLLPQLDAKIVDDHGEEINEYDVRGEIYLRGPTVFAGYLNNLEANELAFDADGWFKTGDVGYCDGKTKLWYLVDRKKELIKVRGFQVAPAELEAVLLSHPEVVEVAVVGVEVDGNKTELPCAFVVRRGSTLTAEDIYKYSALRLAKYKRLDGGVVFVDSIPKTASGKILKRFLRSRFLEKL